MTSSPASSAARWATRTPCAIGRAADRPWPSRGRASAPCAASEPDPSSCSAACPTQRHRSATCAGGRPGLLRRGPAFGTPPPSDRSRRRPSAPSAWPSGASRCRRTASRSTCGRPPSTAPGGPSSCSSTAVGSSRASARPRSSTEAAWRAGVTSWSSPSTSGWGPSDRSSRRSGSATTATPPRTSPSATS